MSNQSNTRSTGTLDFNDEWQFINLEATFVKYLIDSGIAALGNANYSGKGRSDYVRAFLEISVGMERLGKLIIVADYALNHQGCMPDHTYLSDFGHNLKKIFDEIEQIEKIQQVQSDYARPTDSLTTKIVDNLNAFAAGRGRYATFSCMRNPANDQDEPVRKWWMEVAEEILKQHYYGKKIEEEVIYNANIMKDMLSPAFVYFIDETGVPMRNTLDSSIHTGKTQIIQEWSVFHVLAIIRWLAAIYKEISIKAGNGVQRGFLGSDDIFAFYIQDDINLKSYEV